MCSRVNFTSTFYLQLIAHFCLLLLNSSSFFFISCLPIYFPFVRTLLVSFSRVLISVPLFSGLDFSTIIFYGIFHLPLYLHVRTTRAVWFGLFLSRVQHLYAFFIHVSSFSCLMLFSYRTHLQLISVHCI